MTFVIYYKGASYKGNRYIQRNNKSEEGRNYRGGYQLAIVSARARSHNHHITLRALAPLVLRSTNPLCKPCVTTNVIPGRSGHPAVRTPHQKSRLLTHLPNSTTYHATKSLWISAEIGQSRGQDLISPWGYQKWPHQIYSRSSEAIRNTLLTTTRARHTAKPHALIRAQLVINWPNIEEDSLVEWIISMDSRGAAPRPSTIREMANILLAARGKTLRLPLARIGHQPSSNDAMSFVRASRDVTITSAPKTKTLHRYERGLRPYKQWSMRTVSNRRISTTLMRLASRWALYRHRRWLLGRNTTVGDRSYNQEIANGLLRSKQYALDGYSLPPYVIFKGKGCYAWLVWNESTKRLADRGLE